MVVYIQFIYINYMKHFLNKIKTMFTDTQANANEASVADVTSNQGASKLSPEERERRIKHAAEYTVKEYGSVIERLAKE